MEKNTISTLKVWLAKASAIKIQIILPPKQVKKIYKPLFNIFDSLLTIQKDISTVKLYANSKNHTFSRSHNSISLKFHKDLMPDKIYQSVNMTCLDSLKNTSITSQCTNIENTSNIICTCIQLAQAKLYDIEVRTFSQILNKEAVKKLEKVYTSNIGVFFSHIKGLYSCFTKNLKIKFLN